jgi:hypothetical protein
MSNSTPRRSRSTFGTWRSTSRPRSWRRLCAEGAFPPRSSSCPGVTLGRRLAPCLLRSHKDTEAISLVAVLLLRHSADGGDASVYESAPAQSPPQATVAAPPAAPVKPTAPVAAAIPAILPSQAASKVESGGPPVRLPPPLPKSAPAAAAVSSELLLPMNKSRSRSGSMEGSAGYASFKKELQVIFACCRCL